MMILISLSDQLHRVALPSKMTLNGVKQIATMRMKMVAHRVLEYDNDAFVKSHSGFKSRSNISTHISVEIKDYFVKINYISLYFYWKIGLHLSLTSDWKWENWSEKQFLFHPFSYFSKQSKAKEILFQMFLATLRFSWIKMDSVTSAPISKN